MELISMMGGAIFGGIMKLIGKRMDMKHLEHTMLMEKAGLEQKAWTSARTYDNKHFQWTRRIIALASVFSIIVLPKIMGALHPEASLYVGYLETVQKGWWIFANSTDMTLWKPMHGLVITPLDTHLVSAIIGMYFGGSLAGHR